MHWIDNNCNLHLHADEVRLTLRGVHYSQLNSTINITDIGRYDIIDHEDAALVCQTNKRPCCATPPNRAGEWYYPNGTRVPIEGTGSAIYRNRGDEGQVRLNRRNNATYPTGTYTCVVPDANDTIQFVHVTLQYPGMHVDYKQLLLTICFVSITY